MNPFVAGPLRHFTDQLRQTCGTTETPALPDILADTGQIGSIARSILTELPKGEQEILANYCLKRMRDSRWVRSRTNQEVAKVVLDEVCVTAVGAAQELGLSFSSALSRVEAPWMRILVNLELAELLSRSHIYAPSCALAYLQTFRNFESYINQGEFGVGPKRSLFEPFSLAHGDRAAAQSIAFECALPYGEDALRLLWGLQAREQEQGNELGARVLRVEEEWLTERLEHWYTTYRGGKRFAYPWCADLETAIQRSRAAEGPAYARPRDPARAQAVRPLLEDIETLLRHRRNDEALHGLSILTDALKRDRDLEFTTLKNHLLHAGYLKAVALFRSRSSLCSVPSEQAHLRTLWRDLERTFNEPGALWPQSVTHARRGAISEIPKEWRFAPLNLPI